MPILDYTTTNTGLFDRGGKVVKAVNARAATALTDLPAELLYVVNKFELADRTDLITNLYGDYLAAQDAQAAFRRRVAASFDATLGHRADVLVPLGLLRAGLTAQFWEEFFRAMAADTATVLKNTMGVGSVTAASGNTGTGTVLVTSKMDGTNPPLGRRGPALRAYAGVTSELGVAETMRFEVTRDRDSGATSGKESLSWTGAISGAAFDWRGEGSGDGPGLSAAGDGGIVQGDMENFDAANEVPDGWTASTTPTGIFAKDTGTKFRGAASLKVTGNGSSTMYLDYDLAGKLDPLRAYCLSLRVNHAGSAAAGALRVTLIGTGYTPGSTERIDEDLTGSAAAQALRSCFIVTPAALPTDLTLRIKIQTAITAAFVARIDTLALQEVTYHGGLGAVAVPGATDPVRGDRWTVALTQTDASAFQTFARRWWSVQLPSVTSSPSIADALAT